MENNKKQRIYKTIMVIILTAVITFLVTVSAMYSAIINSDSLLLSTTGSNTSSSISEGTKLTKILREFKSILQQEYIGEIDEESMIEGAIKGYISGLGDPYTEYLTTEEMNDLLETTSSKYVGIGVYVANNTTDNTILVIGVMNGSPALEAGMQAGDIIEKIDDVEYKGEELTKATSILKGEEGTTVKVTILRDGEEIDLDITRKTITVEHVASTTLEDNIGYIQVNSFDDGVADRFEKELKKLQENNITGLIIDLRSNGGGVVTEATDIADLFTKKDDTILITKDKEGNETITKSEKDPIIKDLPVVILVNEGTASASEILAGALKDNYGAKLVGKNTYGKGVIQTVYKLKDGSGLKITTNEYFTPSHKEINDVGIAPDVEVDLTKDNEGNYETEQDADAQLLKAIEKIKEDR